MSQLEQVDTGIPLAFLSSGFISFSRLSQVSVHLCVEVSANLVESNLKPATRSYFCKHLVLLGLTIGPDPSFGVIHVGVDVVGMALAVEENVRVVFGDKPRG